MSRSTSSSALRTGFTFACIFFFAALAHAQYRTSIQGAVTDTSGAVVPGANLTLTNPATGEKQVRVSNDAGVYNFNALPAAPFRLEVEKDGFEKKVIDNLQLIPEQANAVNVQLTIGVASQTITVNAETTPLLQTETASINGVVTDNQIEHMPSFGRDVYQLVQLAPGVFGDGAQGSGGNSQALPGTQGPGGTGGNVGIFATENGPQALAAGQQYENNSYSIDGISTTSAVWGGTTVITPSEDSVDNVKVLSNGYDSENGRFSGAQVQLTSKSGSNDVHGSLFFTMHRPGLNAYQPFNGQGQKDLKDDNFFDQFGGSIGGPIWKNKVFFFFDYETVRSPATQPSISNGWYETPAFDKSAPSGSIAATYLTFPGAGVNSTSINPSTCANAGLNEGVNCVTIPGQGLDIGSPLKTALGTQDLGWTSTSNPGVGGGLDGIADIANYVTTSNTTYSKEQYNGRADANLNSTNRIAFAIYWVPQSTTSLNGPARDYNLFHHQQVNNAYSALWNHTFSPSFLNELRVNAAGWRWNEVADNPQAPVGLPTDTIGQIGSLTGSTNISQFGPNIGSILNQWTYTYKDVATKIIRNHTIKFGGEVTRLYYLQECAGCGVPNYAFFNIWDFLNDAPHSENTNFNPVNGFPTTLRQDDRTNLMGFFAQDDFKVRPNLTLNLGLRWSYFSPLSSKENNMFVATPGAGADFLTGLVVHKGNSWTAEKDNIGPQLGFAWSPAVLKDRLVIRGGYGLNYNQEEIAISSGIVNNPGLVVHPTLEMGSPTAPNPGILYAPSTDLHSITGYPANPNAVSPNAFGANGLPTSGSAVSIDLYPNTLPTMRVHHYSLDTQYDLGHKFIASLGYQGTLSRNIYFHENPNVVSSLGYALNPQIGGGDYWNVIGSGNYNAMLAELKHDFGRQFMADTQFVWAKSLDTSSAPYSEQIYPFNTHLNYGRSDYNVGKAFKLYGMWQPVFFHGNRHWIENIAGGWSLSGILNLHSGFPWTPLVSVANGSLYCGACNYTTLQPSAYLGGAGTSTSNNQFKTGSNYPNGGLAYFAIPAYTAYSGSNFGSALPQAPGVERNSLNGPGYKDVDLTLAKGFGFPSNKVLGERARLELRLDAYNIFNNLNFNPTSISNNIASANFGQDTAALAGRVVTLGARFSF
ncbi:MAG TPA: TonB-dependent receptor [Candidatus Sulfotelmatobacter sp.]